jgi:Na+/H+ antiporter NhaA
MSAPVRAPPPASLAFDQGGAAYLGVERLGILSGSIVSGFLGYVVLRACLRDCAMGA